MVEEELGLGLGHVEGEGMKPWEQHAAVISIPRFDYNAPASILEHSHSGFLITCTIKREKSATKEAISILEKFMGSSNGDVFETSDSSDANVATKKRKRCSDEIDREDVNTEENQEAASILEASVGEIAETSLSSAMIDGKVQRGIILSLVKLTRSGLLLFTLPKNNSFQTVDILSNIFYSLGLRDLTPPLWCHRIFPIQATCNLKEKDLRLVVSKLVQQFLGDERNKLETPIKFAVGYNRRGTDETDMKIQKTSAKHSNELTLLDRKECFNVVAGAVKDVAEDSVVDLKSPEIAVLIDLLPLSGLPRGSLVVGVSVLPRSLFATKPRLCVKALISENKPTKVKVNNIT